MSNMFKAPTQKENNIQSQMGNSAGRWITIRKNKMKVLKMKNTVKRNESAFNGLFSRFNSAKENP